MINRGADLCTPPLCCGRQRVNARKKNFTHGLATASGGIVEKYVDKWMTEELLGLGSNPGAAAGGLPEAPTSIQPPCVDVVAVNGEGQGLAATLACYRESLREQGVADPPAAGACVNTHIHDLEARSVHDTSHQEYSNRLMVHVSQEPQARMADAGVLMSPKHVKRVSEPAEVRAVEASLVSGLQRAKEIRQALVGVSYAPQTVRLVRLFRDLVEWAI